MLVRELMTTPPVIVKSDTHIPDVARILRSNNISGAAVVDAAGKLVGIVTDHDLILRNAPIHEPRYLSVLSALIPLNIQEARHYKDQVRHAVAVTAGDFTEPDFHTVTPETSLEDAMELMLDPNVTVLPVVDGEEVVGIVTRNDIVRLIEQLEGALNPEEVEADVESQILGGLIETILYVADMGAMVTFYNDKVGLRLEEPLETSDFSNVDWAVFDTGACKLCLHSGGKKRLGEDTPMIVFGAVDIDDARTILVERGVELGEVKDVAPGIRVCHGRDPEGNPISIEERK